MNTEFSFQISKLTVSPKHHFFGYYGINPWDKSGRFHLALETDFHTHRPVASDVAIVGLVDRETQNFIPYAKTSAFNLQQGSMMHWIDEEFTFNDWENRTLVSRTLNPKTKKKSYDSWCDCGCFTCRTHRYRIELSTYGALS